MHKGNKSKRNLQENLALVDEEITIALLIKDDLKKALKQDYQQEDRKKIDKIEKHGHKLCFFCK